MNEKFKRQYFNGINWIDIDFGDGDENSFACRSEAYDTLEQSDLHNGKPTRIVRGTEIIDEFC